MEVALLVSASAFGMSIKNANVVVRLFFIQVPYELALVLLNAHDSSKIGAHFVQIQD